MSNEKLTATEVLQQEQGPLGRTMQYWIARTLREARIDAGLRSRHVASMADVDIGTVSRFETFKSWPRDLDRMVAAYAHLCGVEDGRHFWQTAIERYSKRGGVPVMGELSPAQRAELAALTAHQRQSPCAGESQGKPTSIRRRRAGGR